MNFTPTDEQWTKMQKHIKSDKYKKEDFFVFETRAVGDKIVPNRYTRLMPEFIKEMEKDAKKGVSLMVNHNWSQLGVQAIPIGKVFDARIGESSQDGETISLYTTQYIPRDDSKIDGYSKNDIINLIESGVVSDTSVGFSTGGYEYHKCSICGNSIYDFRKCEHIPGRKYIVNEETNEVQTCIEELHKPNDLSEEGNNLLMENSLVFDGAYPNAIIQSKFEDANNKNKTFKALEGKEKLSERDVIIGYTSKGEVNLLYTHLLEKGGVELANNKLANEDGNELEETTENIENEEVNTEVNTEITPEETETPEETSDIEETPEENEENSDEENTDEENTDEKIGEPEEENLYTEADIISKFGNIADSFDGLILLAKEGLEIRNDIIEEALKSGVRSMGNAFNKEVFKKTFSSMSIKDIKEMAETWEKQAKIKFSDKKISKFNVENEEEAIDDYSKFKTANY